MADFTEKDREKLDETHDSVLKLKTVLLGTDGDNGVVGQVKENTKRSHQNRIIIALFMGSGTTGMACKVLNREFIGIELNKEYTEIAEKRINNTQESMF